MAGCQAGMAGNRSSLIKEIFRVADQLPELPATQTKAIFKLVDLVGGGPCRG